MSGDLIPTTGSAGARRTDEIAWQNQPPLAWHHWPPSILTAAPRTQPLSELALRVFEGAACALRPWSRLPRSGWAVWGTARTRW